MLLNGNVLCVSADSVHGVIAAEMKCDIMSRLHNEPVTCMQWCMHVTGSLSALVSQLRACSLKCCPALQTSARTRITPSARASKKEFGYCSICSDTVHTCRYTEESTPEWPHKSIAFRQTDRVAIDGGGYM